MSTDYERGVHEGAGYLWQFIVGELRSIAESEIDKPDYALLASTLANHLQNLDIPLPPPEIAAPKARVEELEAAGKLALAYLERDTRKVPAKYAAINVLKKALTPPVKESIR